MKKIKLPEPKYLQCMNMLTIEEGGLSIKNVDSGMTFHMRGIDGAISFFDTEGEELMYYGRDGVPFIDEHAYEDSNIELLNQMSEKLEEKRERIKSLEAKLAEKKEEIKKLQSKLSHLHTYSELKLTISEFEAFVNAYEKIGSNNVFSRDKKVTNEYWTHTSDGTFFEDLEEGTKVYILKKTIHPIMEEGE
jgi:vacuolar-type H+-ATPase subunit I/STV1